MPSSKNIAGRTGRKAMLKFSIVFVFAVCIFLNASIATIIAASARIVTIIAVSIEASAS